MNPEEIKKEFAKDILGKIPDSLVYAGADAGDFLKTIERLGDPRKIAEYVFAHTKKIIKKAAGLN